MEKDHSKDERSIFDLSEKEAEIRLQQSLDKVKLDLFAKGLPLTYQDDRCNSDDHFIHEYEDGRIHLVLFDMNTRTYRLIKDLSHA